MSQNTFPIVGAFYRPPAKALIDALAVGTPLFLLAEPDNQYDPNAVAVWLTSADIPTTGYDLLHEKLPAVGFELDAILAEEYWHLGYIPKEIAAQFRANNTVPLNTNVAVTFSVSARGAPYVRFENAPLD